MNIQEPPKGTQAIPGYILPVFGGSAWITQAGEITNDWQKRGVWKTPEDAQAMMDSIIKQFDEPLTPPAP